MKKWPDVSTRPPCKCAERYCELANKKVEQFFKVSSPCLDDHQFKQEELESVGELSQVFSQIVWKCLYLARIGRPDILWSVNKLATSVTKWTQACDKRLNRLISYIHHTCEYKQHCHVGHTRLIIVDWVCLKTQTLLATLRTRNQPRRSLMYLRKSSICPHLLDVQEANISIPQFCRV